MVEEGSPVFEGRRGLEGMEGMECALSFNLEMSQSLDFQELA